MINQRTSILGIACAPLSFFRSVKRLGWQLLVSCLLAIAFTPAQSAEVTLKLHHFLPKQSASHERFIMQWKKAVEEESNGHIEVEVHPGMELGGKASDLIDQVEKGTVDIVWTLPAYTPDRFPAMSAFELPFMVTNARNASPAVQEYYETNQAAQNEFKSLHPLIFWVHDRGVIHTRNTRVKNLDDLKGLKIRAPSRRVADALKSYGADPVMMPLPQMPKALKTSQLDGTVIPWEVVPALHVHELAPNATEFPGERGLYTSVLTLVMNKEKYESLSDELKKVIDHNSGMVWSKRLGELAVNLETPGRKLSKEQGNSIINMAQDEVDKFRTASYSVHAAWATEMIKKGLNGRGLLYSAYGLLNKYSTTAQ